jgi:hypothetical protein
MNYKEDSAKKYKTALKFIPRTTVYLGKEIRYIINGLRMVNCFTGNLFVSHSDKAEVPRNLYSMGIRELLR